MSQDELGERSKRLTGAALKASLDFFELDWPACVCGSTSSFAKVERGSTTTVYKCAKCAAQAGWRMG